MPTAEIEVLGRAVWRLAESEIPEHASRDWWCQQIIDHVARRAGELTGSTPEAIYLPSDKEDAENRLPKNSCLNDSNAAEIRPVPKTTERSRHEDVSCPRCGAAAGAGCQDLRSASTGKHILNLRPHPERVQAAKSKDRMLRMTRNLFPRRGPRSTRAALVTHE